MDIYQHDSASTFRFVLRGELAGDPVQQLEHAWTTAKSVLDGKELEIDVSGVADADRHGVDLLNRMRASGARFTVALPPASEAFLHSLGVAVAAPGGRFSLLRVLRLFRVSRA